MAVRVPPPLGPLAPAGGPAPLAPCAVGPPALPVRVASCGVLGPVRPLPASRLPAAFCRSASPRWRRGPLWPSGAAARAPARGAVPRRFASSLAPLALAVGAGPRPSLGASFPPAAAPSPPPWPFGLGRRARSASLARVLCLALRPLGLAARALASLRARLGPLRGCGSGGAPPPGPPLRGGFALAPPRRGPLRRPAGGFLAAIAAPGAFSAPTFAQAADPP